MLICPVCRSQNMDSAKFCGNCGNPFPRPSDQTSSLINCAQGHVYSAIYQYCPYCPQPDSDDASSFSTRLEEPVTAISPPGAETVPPFSTQVDFSTRVDAADTLFESQDSVDLSTQVTPLSQGGLLPTEVISTLPAIEPSVESNASTETVKEMPAQNVKTPTINRIDEKINIDEELFDSSPPLPPIEMIQPQPPVKNSPPAQEGDRRTIVMADKSSPVREPRGKIFGWLITFTRNPDGEDFRLYEGYNRLGANPVCDIMIDDETVSGSHSILLCRDDRCVIKDDLSRNGTFVNGREITEAHPLKSYDQIRVGNTYLTFVAAQRS